MNKSHILTISFSLLLLSACGSSEPTNSNSLFTTNITTNKPSSTDENISMSLFASRTRCTAPCSVMFDATDTNSSLNIETFFKLYYSWDYGDSNSKFLNRPSVNANKSTSALGAHVYEQEGNYTVTLKVNNALEKKINIVVNSANEVYKNNTYCVSNNDDFIGCPTQNSSNHFSSYDEASVLLNNLRFNQASKAVRVLFHSGEKFTVKKKVTVRDLTAALQISSYGVGSKPIFSVDTNMTESPLFYFHTSDDITVSNINFQGNYNPATGLGNHPNALFFYLGSSNILVYRNTFSGLGTNVYPHGGSTKNSQKSQFQMIVDNNMQGWQDYAVFGDFGYLSALLGNTIKQDPLAKSGSEGKCRTCVPNFPDHGPLRSAYPNHLLVQNNDMFNNAGWSSGGLAHQPNIRMGTGGLIKKSVLSSNIFNGGFTTVSITPANPTPDSIATRGEIIIEKNQFTASDNTWQMIDMGLGGSVIRNNVFIKPNNLAPMIGTGFFEAAVVYKVGNDNTSLENLTYINHFYNNTLISFAEDSAPNLAMVEVEKYFTKFNIYNNIAYLPFISSSNEAGFLSWKYSAALDDVKCNNNILYSPIQNFIYYNGVSMNLASWQGQSKGSNSISTNPPASNTLTSSSLSIDKGKRINAVQDDYNGKIRDEKVDIGAYEH